MEQSLVTKMFRTKPVEKIVTKWQGRPSSIVENNPSFKKVLGIKELIAFGISSTVGSGIFVISGTAGTYAGAGLFISFILGGITSLFCGLCYAEFSTRVPLSGSAYTYAYCSLGEFVGFIIGWDLTLEYSISAATVAQGWASYLQSLLQSAGLSTPSILFGDNLNSVFTINLTAGALIVVCTILLTYGIRESARFTNFITAFNVTAIVGFIVAGAFFINTENYLHPCSNTEYGTTCQSNQHNSAFPRGYQGVFRAAGIVFFSYVGFDAVSCLAEECTNPRKQMAWGIIGTVLIALSLYVGVSIVLMGMVPFTALNSSAPLSDAFKKHNQDVLGILVSIAALTTTSATTLASLLGQPRIFYSMAKDGLLFETFSTVHEKFRTPIFGSLWSGLLALLLGIFINFNLLANMISVGTLMAYTLVCGGVIVLRYPHPWEDHHKLPKLNSSVALLVCFYTLTCLSLGFCVDNLPSFTFPWLGIVIGIIVIILLCVARFAYIHWTVVPYVPNNVFKTPGMPWIPLLAILINTYLIASLKWDSFARVFGWFVIGCIIYFYYGIHHSLLNDVKRDPLITTSVNDA